MSGDESADLGKAMFSRAIVLRGRLSTRQWRRFLNACAKAMGMTAAGEAAAWRYPTETGKGGKGVTICQPITESFIVLDAWPDHDGAYLFIASCQKFALSHLRDPIARYGLEMDEASALTVLRL